MTHLDLEAKPFALSRDAIEWVVRTRQSLSLRDKLAQLFVLMASGDARSTLSMAEQFRPGGITRLYSDDAAEERALALSLASSLPVPPLISADLEGSRSGQPFATGIPNSLGLAAVDDEAATRDMSAVIAREARATGLNWTFAPVLDINAAWQSAITGTNTFGSDMARVGRHAVASLSGFQENGLAATAKHWPGEGFDLRDQHLVTTVNPLSVEDWHARFGTLYRQAIEAGVTCVMSAHIAFPAYVRAQDPDAGPEAYRPASLNPLLTQRLLREELGFNGLVVSDATTMAGLNDWGPRATILPEILLAGCDMILFSDQPEEDLGHLERAVQDGRLPLPRIDEALTRVLALKARQGLHEAQPEMPPLDVVRCAAHEARAREVLLQVPTLVKDTAGLLPLDPRQQRRMLVVSSGIYEPFRGQSLALALPGWLSDEGFEVTLFESGMRVDPQEYDIIVYLLAEESKIARSRLYLDWLGLTGSVYHAMRRYWHEVPTLMVSLGYPYYLQDAPRVPTYVNAYGASEAIQSAVLEALMGRAPFLGKSPVDPFVGSDQARY